MHVTYYPIQHQLQWGVEWIPISTYFTFIYPTFDIEDDGSFAYVDYRNSEMMIKYQYYKSYVDGLNNSEHFRKWYNSNY